MEINNSIKKLRDNVHINFMFFVSFASVVFMLGVFANNVQSASLSGIVAGDEWRYFKGIKQPPSKWNHLGFDDASWQRGPSPFGYGTGGLETPLPDMRGEYSTLFVRHEFNVNPSDVKQIRLSVVCNGSFIAYINGIEVARSKIKYTEPIDISGFAHELLFVKNVLSIECSNDEIDSESFNFLPTMEILEK